MLISCLTIGKKDLENKLFTMSQGSKRKDEASHNTSQPCPQSNLGTTSSQLEIVLADPRPQLARDRKNQPKVFNSIKRQCAHYEKK